MHKQELRNLAPREIRSHIREEKWCEPTVGLAEGFVQANLVVVPQDLALQFFTFCQRNPRPCPVLEVTEPGVPELRFMASDADLRTDLPRYRIFEKGKCIAEVTNILQYWNDDLVAFLLGCSASFDWALVNAGIQLRHLKPGAASVAYISNIACQPAGPFRGPMAVSMRPIRKDQVARCVQVTSRYPAVHGAPVHIGDPTMIGIPNLKSSILAVRPGQPTDLDPDEIPVFWGCGATPQLVALQAKIDFMITHFPGHMFISDVHTEETAVA